MNPPDQIIVMRVDNGMAGMRLALLVLVGWCIPVLLIYLLAALALRAFIAWGL